MSGPRRKSYGGTLWKRSPPYPISPREKNRKIAIVSSLNTSKPVVYNQRAHKVTSTVSPRVCKSKESYDLKETTEIADKISPSHLTPVSFHIPYSPPSELYPFPDDEYSLYYNGSHSSSPHSYMEREEVHSVDTEEVLSDTIEASSPIGETDSHTDEAQSHTEEPDTEEVHSHALSHTEETEETHSHTQVAHSHTEKAHSHTEGAHSHTEETHSHTEETRSHTEGARSHTERAHSHTEGAHSHTGETHSHTEGAHSHTEETRSHTEGAYSHTEEIQSEISSDTVSSHFISRQEETFFTQEYSSLPEYLAFSEEPIELRSILKVHGLVPSSKPQTARPVSSFSKSRPATTSVLTDSVSPQFQTLHHSVHQFCTDPSLPQLPLQLQILSRITHSFPLSNLQENLSKQRSRMMTREKGEGKRREEGSGEEGGGEGKRGEKGRGGEGEEGKLEVCGVTIPSESDPMRLLWTPAPPKLSLYPLTVKEHLFPKHSRLLNEEGKEGKEAEEMLDIGWSSIVEVDEETEEEEEEVDEEEDEQEKKWSLPKIAEFDSYEKYKMFMNEVTWQREQLCDYHRKVKEQEAIELKRKQQQLLDDDQISQSESQISSGSSGMLTTTSSIIKRSLRKGAGQRRGGVLLPNTGVSLRQTRSALLRAHYLRTEVSKPARLLRRSLSTTLNLSSSEFHKVFACQQETFDKLTKTTSVPSLLDKYCNDRSGSMKWADVLWDQWFYEVLTEVRTAIAKLEKGQIPEVTWKPRLPAQQRQRNYEREETQSVQSFVMERVELASIPPLPSVDHDVQWEISRLTDLIEALRGQVDKRMELANNIASRGSLYRKYGKLGEAKTDLIKSLELCHSLVTPHWDLHLLYLIQGMEKAAVDQLTQLLKKDRKHCLGFISKGTLLANRSDVSDAVNNFTQAIWLEESNARLHFLRAELREKSGETEAAMGDYATVVKLQPHNEEALIRQAKHKFNKSLWRATSHALTTLLDVNHSNTEAWLLRSQAYLKMNNSEAALKDLSSAIHLSPNNALLFYQRGCLLRKHNPDKALSDFSVSILLDSSKNNSLAYLHRGVVYIQLKCYYEALSDFITAGELSPSLAAAHTNAGLVLMNYQEKYKAALKYFTQSLIADPTYTRALLCRAEALTKMNQFHAAVIDWYRAIHLTPNEPSLHLSQGRVYLLLKDYTSANNCIRIASKLDTTMGKSHAQKALVYSFLGEHKKATSILQSNLKGSNIFYLYTVMGKIHLRAGQYKEAVNSFKEALKHLNQTYSLGVNETVEKTTELHYLCGQGLLKEYKYKQAAEEFAHVVGAQPNNVMAHYYRGISLLKQGHSRGLFSINQSLVLQPTFVKAYLARAAYYGLNGRTSKAIMNCSEAISCEPKSVRAYFYRGVLRHQIGYNKAAIDDLTTALSINPTHPTLILFNRAVCYQAVDEKLQALRDYSCILLIEDHPNIKVLINRGLLYLSMEDYFNALKDFTCAKKLTPNDPSLYQAIAYCCHKLGKLEDAISSYTTALSLDSTFIEATIGRGNVYTEYLSDKGNKKAKLDYTRVIHQYPSCWPARVNLALVLQCEGHFMAAWRQLTNILSTNKEPAILYQERIKFGYYSISLSHIISIRSPSYNGINEVELPLVQTKNPSGYTPALEARSIISLQMGNTFGSLLDMTQAINYNPTPLYYTERGTIHYYIGDSINAVRDFEKALQLDSTYILALYNLGNVLLQQRLYGQACDKFSQVLAILPSQDEALINRGLCYMALGKREEALEDLNTAINYNPYAAHAYFNRGNLYKLKGMYKEAEQDYLKALELQPKDVLLLKYHAEVLCHLGRKEEAKEQFMKAAYVEIP